VEIAEGRVAVEHMLGRPASHFAYPVGNMRRPARANSP